MSDSFMGRCGIDCKECECGKQTGCSGCVAMNGKPLWGECRLAKCCMDKKLEHCGQCQDFPCEILNEFAYDAEYGDNGKRISNLREWNEKGYDSWRRTKDAQS